METEATSVTLTRVLESGILGEYEASDDLMHMGVRKLGGEWFKDQKSGKAYGIIEDEDGALQVVEMLDSKVTKPALITRVNITCIDCGEERAVATQDAFQVKRCEECQRKFRNGKRRVYAKARRDRKRKERELNALNHASEKREEEEEQEGEE